MNIFSGTLAGTTLAGTTLAGTTLAGITLEGSTLYDTTNPTSTTTDYCQADQYSEACEWHKNIQSWADLAGTSAMEICDKDRMISSPYCDEAAKLKKWPYTEYAPVQPGTQGYCAPGFVVAKGGGCESDRSKPDVFKQDFCKDGYVNIPGQGCVPKSSVTPASPPGIAIADNTKMIVGAVVVLGLIAYFASQSKGGYARNCELRP